MKIKLFQIFYSICLCLVLGGIGGCNTHSDKDKNKGLKNIKKENIVVVLCDFTTSLDSNSIEKVSEDAYELITNLPKRSKVVFYEIIDQAYKEPFFKYDIRPRSSRPIAKAKFAEDRANMADSLKRLMLDIGNIRINDNTANSCITRGLKQADTAFRTYGKKNTDKYEFSVIILSDMIEECATSPIGNIFMKEKNRTQINGSIHKFQCRLNLSYANLYVIMSSSKSKKDSPYMKNEELEDVWIKIFKKFKFSEKAIDMTIPFSPNVPYFED